MFWELPLVTAWKLCIFDIASTHLHTGGTINAGQKRMVIGCVADNVIPLSI
jgi:hypothetical protein